jgi:hypothetical protein
VPVYRLCGREMRFLAALPPGAVMRLIDGAPRSASMVVSKTSVLLRLDVAAFNGLLKACTPFSLRVLERIAITGIRQLRTTTRRPGRRLTPTPWTRSRRSEPPMPAGGGTWTGWAASRANRSFGRHPR